MSAIDNKNMLEIVAVNLQEGTSKKTGNAYSLPKAQCILRGSDGITRIGELMLPKSLADTKPGTYLAEFVLDISYDLRVVPQVIALHPYATNKTLTPAQAVKA